MKRRSLLHGTAALALAACATPPPSKARVLVVGGGFGGATAAKYIRLWSGGQIEVVLVEPAAQFVSCPLSNLVLGGSRQISELTRGYEDLRRRHGVMVVRDRVARLDTDKKIATLAGGPVIRYDKLVLSPGVEMLWDTIAGLKTAHATGHVLQAWTHAGPETLALRAQLEAMPDGGVFAISIPEAPYRCPPGPYERASVIADYFKQAKPRAKVLILDANPDVTSKPALFKKVWAERYAGMVEYRPLHKAVAVDGAARTLKFELQEDVRADVLNVLPAMRAGAIALQAGLADSNSRWVGVDYLNFAATAARDVHVIGDAIQVAPAMPKSGHMANAHAKVAAAALVAELSGWEINPAPMLTNTCYSFVDAAHVIHVASVHAYVAAQKTYRTVPGSGGVSVTPNALEASYAWHWAQTIWADTLA